MEILIYKAERLRESSYIRALRVYIKAKWDTCFVYIGVIFLLKLKYNYIIKLY